jgi:hypothetical protein
MAKKEPSVARDASHILTFIVRRFVAIAATLWLWSAVILAPSNATASSLCNPSMASEQAAEFWNVGRKQVEGGAFNAASRT